MMVRAVPECGIDSLSSSSVSFKAYSTPEHILGEKKVLYIRANFPDDLREPITYAEAGSVMAQVNDFYSTHSYGLCSIRATVTPLVQLPSPTTTYFFTNEATGQLNWQAYVLLNDARAAALAAGFDAAHYDTFVVRFNAPFRSSAGNLGTPGAWLVNSDPAVTAHEIGHNFGLQHANSWDDLLKVAKEYGDPYDLMGSLAYFHDIGFNTIRKTAMGWLDESHAARVTATGIYRLYAHDAEALVPGRKYVLRIRKDDERDYWIEKRQRIDYADDMESSGVLATWDEWSQSNGRTHLLDPVPSQGWAIPINSVLADRDAGVRVIPLRQSADRSYVDVAVILGSSPLSILPGVLHFSGETNRVYDLQASTDLRAWQTVQQISSDSGELVVPVNTGSAFRFYRVVETPVRR